MKRVKKDSQFSSTRQKSSCASDSQVDDEALKKLKAELNAVTEERDVLSLRLEASIELIENLNENKDKPRVELIEEKAKLQAKQEETEREISLLRTEIKTLKKDCMCLEEENNKNRSELKSKSNVNEKMKDEIESLTLELEKVTGKMRVLEETKSRNDTHRDELDMG